MYSYPVTGKSLAHFFYDFLVAPPDGGGDSPPGIVHENYKKMCKTFAHDY